MSITATVTLKGGLFKGDLTQKVRRALHEDLIEHVAVRMARKGERGSGGTGLGVKRNVVSQQQRNELERLLTSTRIWPRTKGTKWQRKNIGIVKAMAPRVLNKAAKRIAAELGR